MNALRRSTRLARVLAAWVLLWFAGMTAAPWLAAPQAGLDGGAHAAHDSEQALAGDPLALDTHAAHADRASGGSGHCPVCMHAAAPPPPPVADRFGGVAPRSAVAVRAEAHVRVRTAAPPPGRGPPRRS